MCEVALAAGLVHAPFAEFTATVILRRIVCSVELLAMSSSVSLICSLFYFLDWWFSAIVSVPSAPPRAVEAWSTGPKRVVVQWDEVPWRHQNGLVTGYVVHWSRSENGSTEKRKMTSRLSVTLRDLTESTTYWLSVSAVTSMGIGPPSKSLVVRTGNGTYFYCEVKHLQEEQQPTWEIL